MRLPLLFALIVTASGASAQISPPPTPVGVINGSTAAAGQVGEIKQVSVAIGSAVALTSGTSATVASVSLTPGDWDCDGTVLSNPNALTTTATLTGGINTTAATLPTPPAGAYQTSGASVLAGVPHAVAIPRANYNVATSTTVYLVVNAAFATSTLSAYGQLYCRRVR